MQALPVGLYIHLPWCEKKCPYCDFNSHQRDEIPESDYIEALLRDLSQDRILLQGRGVDTVFIGGGTPSLFSASAIDQLLRGLAGLVELAADAEISLEANPGSAEAERFAGFREAGVNRLSLGVQSFADSQLEQLGRVHNSDQAHRAIEMAVSAGFDNFNIDLMHGLPGQSLADAERDLLTAMRYRPTHLSWYQLTIEPNTVFHSRPPTLPAEDQLANIQNSGEALLAATGYRQYEVSAYSLDGFSCRHNLNYWQFGDYLGIGAGAHGKISDCDGRVRRTAKRRQPDDYMSAPANGFTARTSVLTAEDLRAEFVLNALRLNRGFDLGEYSAATGLASASLEPELGALQQRELLQLVGNRVRASVLGRRYLDSVIAEFFPE